MGTGALLGVGRVAGSIAWMTLDRFKISQFYVLMSILGLFVATTGPFQAGGLVAAIAIALTTSGIYLLNDIYDLDIDRVSHPDRALPSGRVSISQAMVAAYMFMALGVAIAFFFDPMAGGLVLSISVLGIAYSIPPIRLRDYPIVPSVVIALLASLSFLTGASLVTNLSAKLVFGAILILAFFYSSSLTKDLQNIEGDRAAGVRSLPVILEEERGTKITIAINLTCYIYPLIFFFYFELSQWFLVAFSVIFIAQLWNMTRFWIHWDDPVISQKCFVRGMIPFAVIQILLVLASIPF